MQRQPFKVLLGLLFLFQGPLWADCGPFKEGDETISSHHGTIAETIEVLGKNYEAIYNDPRRLKNRLYKDKKSNKFVAIVNGKEEKVDPLFTSQIENHLSRALELGYADYVTYADLGHAHLYMPQGQKLDLLSPELTFLYHTAELIRLKDGNILTGSVRQEPWLAWRYYSRNFTAQSLRPQYLEVLFAKGEVYNTIRDLKGKSMVRTVYFTSHKEGCFKYQKDNKDYYFDISFQ